MKPADLSTTPPAAEPPVSERKTENRIADLLITAILVMGGLVAFFSGLGNAPTSDEPIFILSGHAVVQEGLYDFSPEHPPLTPILAGLSLVPLGLRGTAHPPVERQAYAQEEVRVFLYDNRAPEAEVLLFARLPFLLVYLLLCWGVIRWSREWGGPWGGVVGAAAITLYPWCMGSAMIVQTDLVLAASAVWTFYFLHRAFQKRRMFIPFSLLLGLAFASKASAVLFIPFTLALILLDFWRRRKADLRLAVAWGGAVLGAVLLAGVLFTFASRHSTPRETGTIARAVLSGRPGSEGAAHRIESLARWSPGAAHGVLTVTAAFNLVQNRDGVNYIFGRKDTAGFWYYFPAAWLIKSPLPYLFLLAFCFFKGRWGFREAFLWAPILLLFLASMGSSFNIGVRHLSPIFPLAAVFLGMRIGSLKRAAWIAAGWSLTLAALAVAVYPNYLSHFNMFFSHRPERFLVDSNLDWGQDWKRAAALAREMCYGGRVVAVYIGTASPERYFTPPATLYAPGMPVEKGTVYAVSIQARTVGPDILRLWGMRGEADALQEFLSGLESRQFNKIRKLPGIEFYVPKQPGTD
jgi:4-amino-4-deoxy-L-arabinose transferase-like glycosyltransferase